MTSKLWATLVVTVLCFLAPVTARAASYVVSPVIATLDPGSTSTIVELRNQGTEPLRLQLSVHAWAESPTGEMQLTRTTDLVVFPTLLSLAPGDARKVRVGLPAPLVGQADEKAYRLFVEELPPLRTAGAENAVRVLTRMGIPIFVRPSSVSPAVVKLDAPLIAGRSAIVTLRNEGGAHFRARKVLFTLRSATGAVIFEKALTAWYVLSGGRRDYTVAMPACTAAATAEVTVETDAGTRTASAPVPCTP